MNVYLGIDVGGTASRWVAIDEAGSLLMRGAAPSATGHLFADAERSRFEAMAAAIAAKLGTRPARIHAGVTGLGPPAHAQARLILGSALGTASAMITTTDDMALAFHAAFPPGGGHVVSGGTGSVGLHITAGGEIIRVGGRGILIDDGGSGAWIALTAIDRLYRLIDETGGTSGAERLADALFSAMGGRSWDDVRAYVYGNDRGRIGALAPSVAQAALEGDAMARAILEQAAVELGRLAKALVRRAGALPVAFIGGVLDLNPIIRLTLSNALPDLEVGFPKLDAAMRAAELAREASRSTPE